jgi:hypothetical protein
VSKFSLTFLLCALFPMFCQAQVDIWHGVVRDAETKETLPFVNILTSDRTAIATSGIDGKFTISARSGDALYFSYVGYESVRLTLPESGDRFLAVELAVSIQQLSAVEVIAGENPAFEIIRKVLANRSTNDPENLKAFRYKAYHKFYATTEGVFDTAELKTKGGKFLSTHHLFMNETYSERKVLKPSYDEEIVLGNRMTGVKDPFFAILATNFQPFTFYKDHIRLLDKEYLNPVSSGTFDRYDFEVADTVVRESDSTFLISFEPLPGKTFESLKGILYINTTGYAIEHVLAGPADPKALIDVRIQQKYIRIGNTWFPSQLNTEFILKELQVAKHKVKYVHRSYLTEQEIEPLLTRKNFGALNLSFAPAANDRDETFWRNYRLDSLSAKEENTYAFYDSMPARRLATLNSIIKIGEAVAAGKFQFGKFYFPMTHLVRANEYEDFRFGIGIQTSEKISNVFVLESYVAYGVRDKGFKYGGSLQINVFRPKEVFLKISYAKDIFEPGVSNFIVPPATLSGPETLRNWLTLRMDSVTRVKAQIHFRPFPFSAITLFGSREKRTPTSDYTYQTPTEIANEFTIDELGVQIRYAFGETYSQIRNTRILTGYKYPHINVSLSQGFGTEATRGVRFSKVEGKIDHQVLFRAGGKTTLQLHAGWMEGHAPYAYLFNGKGTNTQKFNLNSFVVPNYFQTMGVYEFTSDRFINLFLQHHFGRIVSTRYSYFRPELSLVQNSGYGYLRDPELHTGIVIKSYDKGFFESGLILSNIIRLRYMDVLYVGVGGGAFYRYGAYRLSPAQDNFAYKLSVNFSF